MESILLNEYRKSDLLLVTLCYIGQFWQKADYKTSVFAFIYLLINY